jgi:3-methylcrotonyl-CoA carboxylase beta subunit
VLSTVRGEMTEEEREVFERPIVEAYEREGSPYYSTARLWDDGVIDPLDTRKVLALSLEAARRRPRANTSYGVFRM